MSTLEEKIAKQIWSTDEPDFNAEAEAGTPYQNYNGVLSDIAEIAHNHYSELLEAAQDFINKVDTGRARSTDSYNKFKAAINKALSN